MICDNCEHRYRYECEDRENVQSDCESFRLDYDSLDEEEKERVIRCLEDRR